MSDRDRRPWERGGDDDDDRPPRRRRDDDDEYDHDRPRRRRDDDYDDDDEYYEPRYRKPHRGTLILVLGILGLVACGFLAIAAWIMGAQDLAEMRAGRMDPAGRELTNAGYVLGIIGTALIGLGLAFLVFGLALGLFAV